MAQGDSKKALVWRFNEYGGPEKLSLKSEDVPSPSYGHVRVALRSLSLNQADSFFMGNIYIESPKLPSKIGYEFCGIVDAVGDGVTRFKPGDRVSSIPTFSIGDYGNFAELTNLPEYGLMHTPAKLDDIQGGSFSFAYMTNYYSLFEITSMRSYQTVLITAATSTTGLAAIAMAKVAGVIVIATTRSSSKAEYLKKAGADHVIATNEEDIVERVQALTAGRGVDICYDCIAGTMSEKLVACIRPKGDWIVYGLMDLTPVPFPWLAILGKAIKLNTMMVFQFTGHTHLGFPRDDAMIAKGTEYVEKGLNAGHFPVVINKLFEGLDKLPEAIEYMTSGAGSGKVSLKL